MRITNILIQGRPAMAVSTLLMSLAASSFIKKISVIEIIMIALIGFFMHYFGFLLNDYFDYKFDKDVLSKKNTPLILGKISKNSILISVFIFFILTLCLLHFLHASLVSFIIILCSFSFSVIYNLFSKNSTINKFIPEASLALSISLLCIAIVIIGNYKIEIKFIIWVLLVFLTLLQLNSVSNGLKDIKTDQLNGAVTFVIQNKCTYTDYNKLYVSKKVKYYTYTLQILITAFMLFFIYKFTVVKWISITSILCCFISFWHLKNLLNLNNYTTFHNSHPFLHAYLNFSASIILLQPQLNYTISIFVIIFFILTLTIPIFHFINKIITYGR